MNTDVALLRRAATAMREHADAAILAVGDEPWLWEFGYPGYNITNSVGVAVLENGTEEVADYVASAITVARTYLGEATP